MTLLRGLSAFLLVSMLSMSSSYSPLTGVKVQKLGKNAKASEEVDLGKSLEASPRPTTLIIFGTYAADFNAIEYGQRLKHYMPALKSKGVEDVCLILNARPEACHSLAEFLDLPSDVQLYSDPLGAAGRAFGVSRGWMPDNESVSPYVKLFGMLVGLGAAMTLPYVIAGYIGNPRGHSGWIETSLATGMKQGRWPDTALELDQASGTVIGNKFAELPLVGNWGRRPLELATLRLQNMVGISIQNWDTLAPDDEQLSAGVLTQLGGCMLLGNDEEVKFSWKDPGICAVASFDDILSAL